jgi:hypothetical protein
VTYLAVPVDADASRALGSQSAVGSHGTRARSTINHCFVEGGVEIQAGSATIQGALVGS